MSACNSRRTIASFTYLLSQKRKHVADIVCYVTGNPNEMDDEDDGQSETNMFGKGIKREFEYITFHSSVHSSVSDMMLQ